ncbi:MAG TPA: ATP-binding protein [Candidatus Binatia bacterium]|nr:ATP-binding protein [Candidatus Binatia bacterium]
MSSRRPKPILPSLRRYSAEDLDLLAESADRLLPHAETIAAAWTDELARELESPLRTSFEKLSGVNRQLLERYFTNLRKRRLDRVFEESLEATMALLESERELAPGERSTLAHLHVSLQIASVRVFECLRDLFGGDPRLPAILTVHNRLTLQLAKVIGIGFHEFHSKAAQSALRAVSSLLESSRKLNQSSASVNAVLSDLTGIVRGLVPCDQSFAFLWRAIEGAYAAEASLGVPDPDLPTIGRSRLRRGDFPGIDQILDGKVASGTRRDGPLEMMERLGVMTYAMAPILSAQGKPLGALLAYRCEVAPFSDTDLEILQGVAQNASLAIENAMLVEHLQASARFKSDLINSAPDALVISDSSGRIVLVNDQTVELFGHSREELLGQSVEVLVPLGLLESGGCGFGERNTTSTRLGRDLSGRRKDGTEFPIEVSLSPLRTDDGALVTMAIRDVTDRKRFEAELARARDAALEAVRLKSSFLANMSHEIRTPLNVIGGYNQLIADRLAELGDDSHQEALAGIQRASNRIIRTVQSILDMSKIETSTFETHPVLIQLPVLLEQVVHEFQELAKAKGVSLSCEIKESRAAVLFDEYCLAQALVNLLDNAVKFTERGTITVRLERNSGGDLCLEVRDTGIGIDESYRSRLFERFSQEDSGYTRRFEGSGLGLALVKNYVELNGARIAVHSEKSKGSVFTIRFGAPVQESGGRERESQRQTARPCVLVVEDDDETQNFMKVLLGRSYDVHFAGSGDEMWRLLDARAGRIHLVLMDLSLKGAENGLELTRSLRKHATWKNLPIIAVTAHALTEDRTNALSAGCDAYLEKPINNDRLLDLVKRFLARAPTPAV